MYIIGIDGGGTSTQGKLSNDFLEVLAFSETGATNYHNVGQETAKARIESLLKDLTQSAGIDLDQVNGICFGGAGVDSEADKRVIQSIFEQLNFKGKVIVVNDAVTALVGGTANMSGAVIISGTGSIVYGQLGDRQARCGGFGQLIDDGGSGYALGLGALKGIMEAYDGRRDSTKLWPVVKDHLGIQNEEDIIHFLYHPETGKERIAALAPLVIQLAEEDSLASEIFNKGIDELMAITTGLIRQLKTECFEMSVAGSLLIKSEAYRTAFILKMKEKYPYVEIHLPLEGPVEGALRIIKNHLEKERK